MSIEQLSPNTAIDGGTFFAVNIGGIDMRISSTVLATYLETVLPAQGVKTSQYSAPSATGFSVAVNNASLGVWLILTPLATYATGTIVLPALTNSIDKQEILVNCTQIVTALTIDGNGSTVTGVPASLAANDSFLLRFDAVTNTWFKVG